MNQELWKKCVEFHGHECPGLAIGFRACEAAMEIMDMLTTGTKENGYLLQYCLPNMNKYKKPLKKSRDEKKHG
mgnify:CR=1 FL=1